METNELRIGNLIFCWNPATDKYDTVIETNWKHIRNCVEQPNHGTYKPIPLTEEWLLKFGFKNYDENKWDCDVMVLLKYDDGCVYLANQHYVNIFYVNQLQNLYFTLTGEELKIKQ